MAVLLFNSVSDPLDPSPRFSALLDDLRCHFAAAVAAVKKDDNADADAPTSRRFGRDTVSGSTVRRFRGWNLDAGITANDEEEDDDWALEEKVGLPCGWQLEDLLAWSCPILGVLDREGNADADLFIEDRSFCKHCCKRLNTCPPPPAPLSLSLLVSSLSG